MTEHELTTAAEYLEMEFEQDYQDAIFWEYFAESTGLDVEITE